MRIRGTGRDDGTAELISKPPASENRVVGGTDELAHDGIDLCERRRLVTRVDRQPAPGELEGQPRRVRLACGIRHRPLAIRSMSSGVTLIIRPPLPLTPSVSKTDGKMAIASAEAASRSA